MADEKEYSVQEVKALLAKALRDRVTDYEKSLLELRKRELAKSEALSKAEKLCKDCKKSSALCKCGNKCGKAELCSKSKVIAAPGSGGQMRRGKIPSGRKMAKAAAPLTPPAPPVAKPPAAPAAAPAGAPKIAPAAGAAPKPPAMGKGEHSSGSLHPEGEPGLTTHRVPCSGCGGTGKSRAGGKDHPCTKCNFRGSGKWGQGKGTEVEGRPEKKAEDSGDKYNYYLVHNKTGKVHGGNEYKEDAHEAHADHPDKANLKVMHRSKVSPEAKQEFHTANKIANKLHKDELEKATFQVKGDINKVPSLPGGPAKPQFGMGDLSAGKGALQAAGVKPVSKLGAPTPAGTAGLTPPPKLGAAPPVPAAAALPGVAGPSAPATSQTTGLEKIRAAARLGAAKTVGANPLKMAEEKGDKHEERCECPQCKGKKDAAHVKRMKEEGVDVQAGKGLPFSKK